MKMYLIWNLLMQKLWLPALPDPDRVAGPGAGLEEAFASSRQLELRSQQEQSQERIVPTVGKLYRRLHLLL